MRLLVVEDEPLVAGAVVAALHRQGWAVDTATTLAEPVAGVGGRLRRPRAGRPPPRR